MSDTHPLFGVVFRIWANFWTTCESGTVPPLMFLGSKTDGRVLVVAPVSISQLEQFIAATLGQAEVRFTLCHSDAGPHWLGHATVLGAQAV